MSLDMPPTRYRVVERGRRLIVIDTRTGAPVAAPDRGQQARLDQLASRERGSDTPADAPARTLQAPRRPTPGPARGPVSGEADVGILTTQSWFDDKAPRRVRIGEGAATFSGVTAIILLVLASVALVMFGWPLAIFAGFLLLQPRVRNTLRGLATKWLDGMEQV